MAGRSRIAVVLAASIGVGLALAEFLVAGLGESSIMLSEGIRSGIAAANDGLLLIGMKKSQRPPDSQLPFGYSKELYIWSMIVATSILGLASEIVNALGRIQEGVASRFPSIKHIYVQPKGNAEAYG